MKYLIVGFDDVDLPVSVEANEQGDEALILDEWDEATEMLQRFGHHLDAGLRWDIVEVSTQEDID